MGNKLESLTIGAYASCEQATGTMDALILPQVNIQCMQIFLDTVAARHVDDHIVMVMDGAGWHSSKKLVAPSNIRLLALSPYAPELNPVEHLWDELREKCFHDKVFASNGALEDDLAMGLLAMENTPEVIRSITNWPWIIDVYRSGNRIRIRFPAPAPPSLGAGKAKPALPSAHGS